jgi:DNA/RNA endonuclease G (NUC1)/PKD repeat protein
MMRCVIRTSLIIAATVAAASCGTEPGGLALVSQAVSVPAVRFAEIHYDNTGTDAGEAIEVSGPAGMDVTGWQVILYNGTGGASYDTKTLSGTIPATCGARGVLVINYPVNGIQNGSPDGMALIDASGAVVEFLSYEGTFAATNGPANGLTSTDIGASEAGTEPIGGSLQRSADGVWTKSLTNTFGTCNDNGGTPPPPPPVVASVTVTPASATVIVGGTQAFTAAAFDAAQQPIPGITFTWASSATAIATVNAGGVATAVATGDATISAAAPNGVSGSAALHVNPAPQPGFPDTRFSELHYDNVGVDAGEAIEIEGPAGMDVTGWTIVLYDGTNSTAYSTQTLSGTIPATCGARGVIVVNYPSNGIQNGSPDGMALVDAGGRLVEFLSYEGTFTAVGGPANGVASTDIIAQEPSNTPVGQSLQRDAFNHWSGPSTSSFGACNAAGAPPPPNSISFSGRAPSDPALPVGFQSQLFATERTAANVTVPTTFVWSSDTPDIATVDQFGVITAIAAGNAVFRATAEDGTTGTWPLPTRVAVASTTASYAGNTEFGEPTDADPSDDFIVRHAEFTLSYNPNRGEPNWVSYDLDASAFGDEDRCNCFTFDPDLPASFTHLTTQDYTGAGAAAGFSIDRGHMTRSFDRTTSSLDNAHTFLLSNVVPQASDLNQGPWSDFEIFVGDKARFENKEVYIITGPAGSQGTVKNEGKIVIPTSTWKVAVIMDRNHGLADIRDYRDLEVIAVNMPNMPGIRNVPWQTYLTTVDQIEALTGYDLLARLPDKVENAVEAGIKPPLAAIDGPYAGAEGSSIAMSAAASLDPNGTVVSYAWNFGDGTTGTGSSVTHTYARGGVYTITITVTDNDNLSDTIQTTATVAIVPPIAAIDGPYTGSEGSAVAMSAAASRDPNGTVVSYAWAFGDGTSGTGPAALHTYAQDGVYTVTVTVTDNDGRTDTIQTIATVANVAPAVAPIAGALLLPAETYAASGSFTDPGMDPWTATVDYGDGSGPTSLALSGMSFALAHTYRAAGVFTVTVSVSDDHATATATQTVTVISQAQAVRNLMALIEMLSVSGEIRRNIAILLDAQLEVAASALDARQPIVALAVLDAVLIELDVFARLRQIPAIDAQLLRAAINRIRTSIAATSGIPH